MKTNTKVRTLLDYILLILGGVLVGVSVGLLLIPLKITTGGFSGIATIFYYLFNIPAELALLLLNVPAFIITWKVLGVKYGFRSFVGMVSCSIGITIGESFGTITTDLLLAALYGGVTSGIGIALTYISGGSTGGTDLIARLVHEKKPYMNMGEILLVVDGLIILTLSFTFESIEIALYSIISAYVLTKVIDLILDGANYAKGVFVITTKPDEISDFIHDELNRTATLINATGTYTKSEKNILLCVASKSEIPKLKKCISEIDNKAFVIVTTVTEAIGEGFKEM